MRRPSFFHLPLLAVLASACSNPTSPSETTTTSSDAVTFASTLAPGGTASQSFIAAGAGTVAVTLTSTSPAGLSMGIGVGIPSSAVRGGCSLARTAWTPAGSQPQLQIDVDTGSYCVQVYDSGQLTETASFSLSYVHP